MNKLITLHIILLVGFSHILFSQEKLSAENAVMIALENNYQMQIAEKQNAITDKNNKWSEAGLFPTVELSAALGNSIIDNSNNPFTFTPGLISSRSVTPGATVNWNLFSGFRVLISKQRLALLEEQSKENGLLMLENTALDVLKAYYNVLLQKERKKVFQELYQFSIKQLNYEQTKAEFGSSNKLSVYQLSNQVFSDSINVIQQSISEKNAYRNLILLMNVDMEELENDVFPELADSLSLKLDPLSLSDLREQMMSNNQNLKNQFINLELQQKNTELQRSFLYPTLNLQLGAQPNFGNFRSLSNSAINANTQQITYFGNINLRYNLYNNWKDKRAVEVSKIQEEIATYNLQELEKQLVVNLKNLVDNYQIRNELLSLAQQNTAYAELAFQIGRERYELGQINSIELAQLQNAYMNAKMDYFDSLYQRLDIYLEIMKATGKLQLEYSGE
jgi:outer membrane protein TolC